MEGPELSGPDETRRTRTTTRRRMEDNSAMAWFVLIVSGLFEAVWATALSNSRGFTKLIPSVVFAIAVAISMGGKGSTYSGASCCSDKRSHLFTLLSAADLSDR